MPPCDATYQIQVESAHMAPMPKASLRKPTRQMPFVLDVGKGLLSLRLSPLKRDMGKQQRSPTDQDPGDNKTKQLKCETRAEAPRNTESDEVFPSAKEMAAALAARARLYGGAVETSTGVCTCSQLWVMQY